MVFIKWALKFNNKKIDFLKLTDEETPLTRNSSCSQITSSWGGFELERLRDIEVGINVLRVIEVTDFIYVNTNYSMFNYLYTLLYCFHISTYRGLHVIYSSYGGCWTEILHEKDFVGRNDFEL